MKKTYLVILILFVFCLAFAGFRGINVSAQNDGGKSGTTNTQQNNIEKDREWAATLRRITNRSFDDLTEKKVRGGFSFDLEDRFQTVMLSRIDPDGETVTACVTSLPEANAFFGRDLETGRDLSAYQAQFRHDDTANLAAKNGMSAQEYKFYSEMIEKAYGNRPMNPQNATITIDNQDGAGEGFNDPQAVTPEGGNPGTTLGEQRLNVFKEGARIWGAFLDSSVPIVIRGNFDPLPCDNNGATLGSAGPTGGYRDFATQSPMNNTFYFPNTLYYVALANKISRMDLNNADAEIQSRYNSSVNNQAGCLNGGRFYYGFDNNPTNNTVNLLITVLHEIGHGLGFGGFVNPNTGELAKDGNGNPISDIYTRMMFDRTLGKYWYQMTDAERQQSKLNAGNVLWDGANVKIASGFLTAGREASTGRVQLYTPMTLEPGSSIVHWDTAATPNLLMEPAINSDLTTTLDLTRQQMRDIGWFRDTDPSDTVRDAVINVTPNSGTAVVGSTQNITWTNVGGFNKNVTIELSTDGGATYPNTIAANAPNTGSYSWTVPDMRTTTARIRVREVDFIDPSGTSSGNFAIGLAPTAAAVSISGRVLTPEGRGVTNARVMLTDQNGTTRTAMTTSFGYFHFTDVPAGETVVISVISKRYTFAPQVFSVTEDLTGINFINY